MNDTRTGKVAVIGTINRDTVIRTDRSKAQGYGGILYNICVLTGLVGEDVSIIPVANIGKDHDKAIRSILNSSKCVDHSALRTVQARNNHCLLTYLSDSEKTERLAGWVGSVSRQQLKLITEVDYILVNFISGSDITTDNLHWLRSRTTARIYIDFHSRTLGRRADGTRFLRRPRDWHETVDCADILQMNEVEFRLLAQESAGLDSCKQFMRSRLSSSSEGMLVTLAERGCIACYREEGRISARLVSARKPGRVVDTTGCGDTFAAAFISARLRRLGFIEAAGLAVGLATFRVSRGNPTADDYRKAASRLISGFVAL